MGIDVAKQQALIVDDSDVLRRLIEMCLRPTGIKTVPASTGAEAVELASAIDPDIVLLDIGLPDMTGWEVLERLRQSEINAGTKVMILSGYEDIHHEAKKRGADGALVKPFRNDELRNAVVEMLASSSEIVSSA